jgi:hypothetical protein
MTLGHPVFANPELAELSSAAGTLTAWQAALRSGRAGQAAAGVRGDFAVALREPSARVFLAVDRFAVLMLCYPVTGGARDHCLRAGAAPAVWR